MNRLLVLAPLGRDAELIEKSLSSDAVACSTVVTIDALCDGLHDDAGAAVIFEEALPEASLAKLISHLSSQPPWSVFPLIILTASQVSNAMSRIYARLSVNCHVTLLQRPLHPLTLRTAVNVALRARQRQYERRDQIRHLAEQDEALRRANEALEASNRDLQQFVYAASHDLKEPLRMIQSYAQLTKKRYAAQLESAANSFLDVVIDGAMRMDALLEDLLMYSRTSRSDHVPAGPVDCNVVLQKTLSNLEIAIRETDAEIHADTLPTIIAHETRMVQLFQNLISNAIRYRKKTRPLRIDISATLDNDVWLFAFKDNGIGIEAPYREKIFVLFQRLHAASESGSGIGLALCEKIVHQYGGKIWVEGDVSEGAIFKFTLPVKRLEVSNISTQRQPSG